MVIYTPQDILDFQNGARNHPSGFTFEEMLSQDDNWWESTHDFIQWMFPNNEPSKAQPETPYLADLSYYQLLNHQLIAAASYRFFEFLKDNKDFRAGYPTHNDLRVTQMIKCVSLIQVSGHREEIPMAVWYFYKTIGLVEGSKDWDVVKYWHQACEGYRLIPKVEEKL
jgi:hypothetical protein